MSEPSFRYTAELAGQIETAWQDRWEAEETFCALNPAGVWADPAQADLRGEKLYVRWNDQEHLTSVPTACLLQCSL